MGRPCRAKKRGRWLVCIESAVSERIGRKIEQTRRRASLFPALSGQHQRPVKIIIDRCRLLRGLANRHHRRDQRIDAATDRILESFRLPAGSGSTAALLTAQRNSGLPPCASWRRAPSARMRRCSATCP